MVEDLVSVAGNQSDPLFELFQTDLDKNGKLRDLENNEIYEKLEKLFIFKSELKQKNIDNEKSSFSMHGLSEDIESLETRVNSLQNFIDISKKFFSINK